MNRRVIAVAVVSILIGGAGVGFWFLRKPMEPNETVAPAGPGARRPELRIANARHRAPVVPSLVRRITDPSLHRATRIEAIRELPSDLSREELAALEDLFRQPPPADMSAAAWYVVINELMTVLAQPRLAWHDYGTVMSGLLSDRHLDPVIRDYAAQNLMTWLRGPVAAGLSEEQRIALLRSYLPVMEGTREAYEPVLGTSLMMICDLRDNCGEEALEPIRVSIEPVICGYVDGTVAASLANRISAIQAAGRIGIKPALPKVRTLARDSGTEPSIRLSCVAALGYFGDPADRPFLEELATGGSRLRFAAQQALLNQTR